MTGAKRQNPMLVEMLITLLFFALCACILVSVFADAYKTGENALSQQEALLHAQDIAEKYRLTGALDEDWMLYDGAYVQDRTFSKTLYRFVITDRVGAEGLSLSVYRGESECFKFNMPGRGIYGQ